jgi:hypothetical protein
MFKRWFYMFLILVWWLSNCYTFAGWSIDKAMFSKFVSLSGTDFSIIFDALFGFLIATTVTCFAVIGLLNFGKYLAGKYKLLSWLA